MDDKVLVSIASTMSQAKVMITSLRMLDSSRGCVSPSFAEGNVPQIYHGMYLEMGWAIYTW